MRVLLSEGSSLAAREVITALGRGASGVPLPELQLRLSAGESFAGPPVIGRPGVRTHSLMAICLAAADRTGQRRAVLAELGAAILRRRTYRGSREVLTPVLADPVSALALGFVVARLLARPGPRRTWPAGRSRRTR